MKAYKLILVLLTFSLLFSPILYSQESPIIRLEGEGKPIEPFGLQIVSKPVASLVDIQVYPSSNYQSEESITINSVDLNNLSIALCWLGGCEMP